MANIKLTLPGEPFTKQIVTFTAPCGCDQVTDGLVINGETYTVCDAMGECVTGKGGAWCAGAQISVVLDCENKKAYIQNAASPNLKEALNAHINDATNPHNVQASQVPVGESVVELLSETEGLSVDDALAHISGYLFSDEQVYRWKKSGEAVRITEKISSEDFGNIVADADIVESIRVAFEYSDKCTFNSDGDITLVNPQTLEFFKGDTSEIQSRTQVMSGKYFTCVDGFLFAKGSVYLMTEETLFKVVATEYDHINSIYGYNLSRVKVKNVSEVVTDTDPNAHYDGETDEEGLVYSSMPPIGTSVKMAKGSYVGTGTYGAKNPVNVPLPFVPTYFCVYAKTGMSSVTSDIKTDWIDPLYSQINCAVLNTESYTENNGPASEKTMVTACAKLLEDGKGVSWYHKNVGSTSNASASTQLNAGSTYHWFATNL